ncbi:MAG: FHA domain-containing protein [Gemmatimonadota bacterium]|jgi:hypothetical protein|nr:FHA domain-containing protein [Gemmatimonadota bacterium]
MADSAGSSERVVAIFESIEGSPSSSFPVRGGVTTIGQSPRNPIVIEDETVSSTHARLEYLEGAGWRLTDLRSRNGTSINGTRLVADVPTTLPDGAEVRFGAARLTFRASAPAEFVAVPAPEATPRAPQLVSPLPAKRSPGFRLPVWVAVLLILVVLAVAFFVLSLTGDQHATRLFTESTNLVVAALSDAFPG